MKRSRNYSGGNLHITLKQLSVFRAVATLGKVQLAARQLHLSQPATSMSLAELEKHLGNPLFDRAGNRLVLNNEGRKLLPMACELLDRSLEINRLFTGDGLHTGNLVMGASTTIGNYLLPGILARFNKANPEVSLDLKIHNTSTIIERLASLELDLACVEGPCQHHEIESIPWLKDELVLFCAPEHPLAQLKTASLKQLEKAHWILRERGSGTRLLFERHIGQHLQQRNLRIELNQTEAIKNMVRSGAGISCLSELCLSNELAREELSRIHIPRHTMTRQLWLLLSRKKYKNALVNQLLTLVSQVSA